MAKQQSSREEQSSSKKRNRKMKQKNTDNYLDFIPVPNDMFQWKADEEGKVTIFVENKGVFNRIAQKLLGKPKVSQVHLEEMGNFIWPLLDGKRSIYEIGILVQEEFGERAEPLYPRLVQYMRNLDSYGFIQMKKPVSQNNDLEGLIK